MEAIWIVELRGGCSSFAFEERLCIGSNLPLRCRMQSNRATIEATTDGEILAS